MTLQNSLIKEINQAYGNLKIKKKFVLDIVLLLSDTFPILGETSIKGLYITTGTKRDGLSMSLFIAKCISNSILKLKNNYKFPEMFKPERKIISTMSLKEGLKKC